MSSFAIAPRAALHPDTGETVTVIGVDLTSHCGPKLIVIVNDTESVYPEILDHVKPLPE